MAAAARVEQAHDELASLVPGSAPTELTWAMRHARMIAHSLRMWSADFEDPEQATEAFRYREWAMADTVLWWHRQTGHRMLLSAANGHVARRSFWPDHPKVQGTFLAEQLGTGYVSVGVTFHQGATLARAGHEAPLEKVTLGPAAAGSNEEMLERVRWTDFLVDNRAAGPAARAWLAQPRPTRSIGEFYPEPEVTVPLGTTYDAVVHLARIRPARLRG
ncbi:MAG TPA: erythromycin esterase family protein [Micromonospora sp.]